MHVVHIASGDAWGGQERVVSLLTEALARRPGVTLDVLLLNEGRLADHLRRIGVRVELLPEAGRSFPALVAETRRWLRARPVDVVHAHRYKEFVLALLASWPRSERVVVTVHGLEPRAQLSAFEAARIWGALLGVRLAGGEIVAVSDELEQRLARALRTQRVHSIPNPMPDAPGAGAAGPDLRARLGWPADRPLVGFVGRLETVKGPDRLLEIAALCDPRIGFAVIGDGDMRAELETRVRARGLAGRVGFLGELPDAMRCFPQLDVLALTSRHEGLPMVLLEAAACGLPVVAFAVGGVPQVLDGGPGARLVSAGDVGGFRREIEAVLADPARSRAEARRASAALRQRFGMPAIVAAYTKVYAAHARPRD